MGANNAHINFVVMRHVNKIAALLIMWAATTTAASSDILSKDAIVNFFTTKGKPLEINTESKTIEICYSNTCSLYQLELGVDNPQSWDVVFLHQYYYIGTNEFQKEFETENADLAKTLMEKYEQLCPRVESLGKPGCVIGYLGLKNNIRYAFVYYKDDMRCEAWTHLVHSKTTYGSSCQKE